MNRVTTTSWMDARMTSVESYVTWYCSPEGND